VFLRTEAIAQGQGNLGQGNPNARLKGEYTFTLKRTCVNAPSFSQTLIPTGFPITRDGTVHGIVIYNGDGTGTYSHVLLDINTAPGVGQLPLVHGEITCDLTNSVRPDGSFTQALSNCSFRVFSGGPGPNATGTINGIQNEGQILPGGQTLLFFDTNPAVETITVQTPSFNESQRICNRSGTAIRTSPW
jgi:hypothetical protein